MVYFIVFLAGMGFAALVDFMYAAILRRRVRLTVDFENDVLAIDPSTTKVGNDQMARIRQNLGM